MAGFFKKFDYVKKILVLTFFITGLFSNVLAQLSPGELHKAHAFLEGIENCTKCHAQGQKLAPENCLNCHSTLKEEINQNKGLHAAGEYKDCATCHVDHLGRDYELVYWGKGGKDSFDHSKTGYQLQGAHANLKCNQCHTEEHIVDKDRLKQKDKDLKRTFLGLSKNCTTCHQDEHRGQLNSDCLNCHTMDSWQKQTGFNHNKTKFVLSGKHNAVKCQQCHKIIRDEKYTDNPTYLNFRIDKFNTCMDCHNDIHNNRFGKNCSKCHNTSGWSNYNKNSFDHTKTKYPLQGQHTFVRCEQCHKPGQPMKIGRYQKCMDCHSDEHQGQFSNRVQKGACEECHTVQGFSPSHFTMEMHQQCAYSLQGSHLAVPCLECHKKQVSPAHREFIPFRFKNTRCLTCHDDIHHGQTSLVTDKSGCEGCHSVESWHNVSFDHSSTAFPLEGKHSKTGCISCHAQQDAAVKQQWHFKGVNKECSNCHEDIHQGQFSRLNQNVDCARCHSPIDWLADRFDHEKDSNFSLRGAHQYVPCNQCHKAQERNGLQLVIYKPLDKKCESCHKQ